MANPRLNSIPGLYREALDAGHSPEELAELTTGSQKELNWKGSCGHTWPARISSRTRKEPTGCPYCSGSEVLPGFNDLAHCNPKLAAEWHPNKNGQHRPSDFTRSSKHKAWWFGNCGHEWDASIGSRNIGRGCRFCSGREVLAGFNDIATSHPLLAERVSVNSPLKASEVSFGSHKRPIWSGTCVHEWDAEVASMHRGGSCPFCSGHRLLAGFNDLATKAPKIAAEWDLERNHGVKPSEVAFGSHSLSWWRGSVCGHTWEASIGNRTNNGHGCSICAGKTVQPGVNDIATLLPQLLSDWNYVRNPEGPTELTWGTRKKVWFTCAIGHDWDSNPATRVSRNLSCPYCSRRKLMVGFNDFATVCHEAAEEWDYARNGSQIPSHYLPGSEKKFWFICQKNHSWFASLHSRYHQASGCPACAEYGFNPEEPGRIYFIENQSLTSYKLGITNTFAKTNRVREFETRGWEVIRTWDFDSGSDAYEVEQQFFIWLRGEVGLGISCSKSDLRGMRGYTETFSMGVLREASLKTKVESLIKLL